MKTLTLLSLFLLPSFAQASSFDETMGKILEDYLVMHASLSDDKTDGVKAAAVRILATSKKLSLKDAPKKFGNHYKNVPSQIKMAAEKISKVDSIKSMREQFKELSRPMANWVEMHQPKGTDVYFCSMAGSSWVQKAASTANPYYGKSMLTCGEKVKHAKKDHNHSH